MWTPNNSNKSISNRADISGRTQMTPCSTPFLPSSVVSNESGGNNKELHNNIHESFNPYFPGSFESRSSRNIVDLPSGIQQTQEGRWSSMTNTSHILTNESSGQLPLGSSHGHSGIIRSGGAPLFPNNPRLIPTHGHTRQIVNSFGGLVRADGSGSSSTGLANVSGSSSSSCVNLSGGFNFEGVGDYSATHHRHKEHVVQPQYPQYQHFQQPPPPRLHNPLRVKEVAQGSLRGPDDYGLLGLLKIIKGSNPAKTALVMGVDPHTLGLELNSLEPLHPKFASPWSEEPVKEGPKYDIPYCYNSKQPPPLKAEIHFKKFHLATLFYIFYSMPKDQAQLFAANELHERGWYYHKELRMWFTRNKNSVPTVKNETFEVGSLIFFDPSTWEMMRQENVVLYYEMIEQRPEIPL